MRKDFKRGQSILEYTLLLSMVIAIIVTVLMAKGGLRGKVKSSYDKVGDALEEATSNLTSSVFR